jgi:membrane fusion protein, multidrug efflux system
MRPTLDMRSELAHRKPAVAPKLPYDASDSGSSSSNQKARLSTASGVVFLELNTFQIGDAGSKTVADAMRAEMNEKEGANRGEARPTDPLAASESVAAEHAAPPSPSLPPDQLPSRRRRLLIGVLASVVLAAVGIFGVPWIISSLNTVSTDDAYVNGHVTFVAPRVAGQISRVLVDDNNRVHKGELLAELDKQPFQDAVAVKSAAVDTAAANLAAAKATVRAIEAQARARRWGLQNAIQDVDDNIALLHARIAALDKNKAELTLAHADFYRAQRLLGTPAESRQAFDRAQRALSTASAQVTESLAEVHRVRASLGLPAQPDGGKDLGQVPPDLDETFSAVLVAQANLIQTAAQLGVIHSYDQTPKQMIEEFEKQGDIDRTFARLEAEAPAVKQAEAKLEFAKRELAQSELDLGFCDIVAKIDGVVTRRNVNPGNYVQVGENLMAIRSLREIWVDANFKETQLHDLRIGLPVDLYVDMYGARHVFSGRVSGFTMGTGSTLALLPAQNATGNFVKVVQRLPVRIDLEGYDPDKDTLFIGTSVAPYVYINKPPTGPDAGKLLQTGLPQTQASGSPGGSPGGSLGADK